MPEPYVVGPVTCAGRIPAGVRDARERVPAGTSVRGPGPVQLPPDATEQSTT
ncbi:Hypothetical protein SCLAV_p0371 (plasmid) [Streptomyces clavuligerus]|uniref:Uncharacterized protein n=1 Tax=Streptomyces clavuligerus TaxID=1901 RepID=B5GS70_STRCL|nr:hypothetical protein SSCG_02194 [Streptomyces clavuligerus]EFG03861.1 Hypothetical protein SCLAV_p0371 [Streptomyces clavuligerus]